MDVVAVLVAKLLSGLLIAQQLHVIYPPYDQWLVGRSNWWEGPGDDCRTGTGDGDVGKAVDAVVEDKGKVPADLRSLASNHYFLRFADGRGPSGPFLLSYWVGFFILHPFTVFSLDPLLSFENAGGMPEFEKYSKIVAQRFDMKIESFVSNHFGVSSL